MAKRNIPAGLVSVGYQKITTNSTATTLNSTCRVAHTFLISVETQSLRLTFDGTVPAASTGILYLATNSPFLLEGVDGTALKIKGAAVGAVLNIQAFKYKGE